MGRRSGFKLKFARDKRRSPVATALAWIAAGPFVLIALLTLASRHLWLADMAANFAWPLALLALVPFVVAIACRRPVPAVLALLAIVTLTVRAVGVPRAEPGTQADARVLIFNAYAETTEHEKTLEMLRAVEADVVLLNEIDYELAVAIEADDALTARYPHREFPEHDNQWTRGVMSVWPLTRLEQRDDRWRELRFEYLYRRAQIVEHPGSPFVAGVTLFESPRSPARWRTGNDRLRTEAALIASDLKTHGLPVVIGADLNASPTGARTAILRDLTGLVRAKPFAETSGTWPASFPKALRVPIDDLLVTPDVRITSWTTLDHETNSDHVPILVTIELPPAQAATSQAP